MFRKAQNDLDEWFHRSPHQARKPLIIRGARQVGKSYLVRDFCERNRFKCLELNLERDPKLRNLFVDGPNKKTIELLEAHFKLSFDGSTLLFVDEIQAAPAVLARLRYFHEETPEIPVIAAGSLLEFALGDFEQSVPVGRIEYFHLGPMSFEEVLMAAKEERLVTILTSWKIGDEPIPESIHEKLLEYVRVFSLVGGMPEAVAEYVRTGTLKRIEEIQRGIVATYRDDFSKYRRRIPLDRLQRLFDAIPARVGRKWVHSQVNPEEKALSSQQALEALCEARVAFRVCHSSGNGVPLGAEANDRYYKVLSLDVGLMANHLGLRISEYSETETIETIARGSIAEQWIGQHLLELRPRSAAPEIYYWVREKAGAQAEVDYLLQHGSRVLPIEVKAGSSTKAKSLVVFLAEKKRSPLALHFSVTQPEWIAAKKILRLPFYMVEQVPRLVEQLLVNVSESAKR